MVLEKAPNAFRTISEVADEIDVPQHVLRFWESRFPQIKPMKRGGGRRYYRPDDVDLLRGIRHLLYGEGYTIRGVQRILREHGAGFVQDVWRAGAAPPPPETEEDRVEDEVTSSARSKLRSPLQALDEQVRGAKVGTDKSGSADAAPERRATAPDNRRKLQAALDELLACRRIIDGALRED
jgi:DNA-binding transcriptional MerR regulator